MLLLKLSLRPWRRGPLGQTLNSLAIGFLLFLIGFLFWLQGALNPIIKRLQQEQVITAYISPEVPEEESSRIIDQLRAKIGEIGVSKAEISYTGMKAFIEKISARYPRLSGELLNLGGEIQEVVPRYITLSGILPERVLGDVQAIPGVSGVETSSHRFRYLVSSFSTLRWVVRVLLLGLVIALFTGLLHLARSNVFLHADAIRVLKYWGAGPISIRVPGLLGTLSVAFVGGLLAFLGWWGLGAAMGSELAQFFPMIGEVSLPSFSLGVSLFLVGMISAAGASLMGGTTVGVPVSK